jgi:hypothetical protein
MKARWGWRAVQAVMVLTMLLAGVILLAGCASNKRVDQLLAQTQVQSERAAATEAVLLKLAERDNGVIPDTVAHVEDGSTVGWAQSKRCIRDKDNNPLLTPDGMAQFETTAAIGKSKSSREFGNITKGTIKLAGVGFDLATGELVPSSILEGVVVHIEGAGGSSTVNAEWASVWGNAVAAEKTAIVSGMAQLATARGAAYAVKCEALSNGLAKFVTAAGEVTGTILSKTIVPTPVELAAAGVTKLVQAIVKKADGSTQAVLTADTATSTAATECEGCSEPGN